MKIGILQTGHAPDELIAGHGDYPAQFRRLLAGHGFDFDDYPVVDGIFPESIHAADGWLITGSRHGVYEDHFWIPPLERFIRTAYAAHVPVAGICFGHQIVAQALGGKAEKFSGGWVVGPQTYRLAEGGEITLNAWHQDQVTRRPEGAEVLASHPFCENAILAYGDRAYTVQAHPEFDDAFVQGLIETRGRGLVPEPVLDEAGRRLGRPLGTAAIAERIAAFFKQPREVQA